MAAKNAKQVSVVVDSATLRKLGGASRSLSELASAAITATDDPSVRARLPKKDG